MRRQLVQKRTGVYARTRPNRKSAAKPTLPSASAHDLAEGFLADVGLPVLRTLKINGYPLYYPKRLAKRLNQQRPITADQAQRLQAGLDRRLPPAIQAA